MKTQTIARLALPLAVAAGLGLGCVPAVQTFTNVLAPAQAWAATNDSYNDGTYTAEGKGIGGKVPVTVEVKGGKIATVTVGDNSETQGIGSKAIEQLPSAIVAANGTEGVDATSGATVTSKAIFTAVDDCLEQAKSGASSAEAGLWYNDGTYTAEGKGIGGKVPVEVSIKGGVIASVTVGDNSETQGIGSKAIEQLPGKIVEANGIEGVDAVSGATVTSKAIFTAVDDCLEQAGTTNVAPTGAAADEKAEEAAPAEETGEAPASDAAYTDGEYTASGKGIGGEVPVTVEVKSGVIVSVTVGDNSETQGIGSKAIEQLPDAIVAANGTEGVDAVSGAPVTSKAIFTAVDEALEQAKGGATDEAKADDKAADAKDEKAEPAAEETKAEASLWYNDGTYTAEGKGIGGKVPVTVTVKGGAIASVEVGDNSETQGIGSKAIEQLPAAIVAANGTEGVDGVSGATVTSKAIFTAVDEALEQAQGGAAAEQAAPAEDEKADEKAEPAAEETKAEANLWYNDGTYTASGKGIGGKVPVTVEVRSGVIASVEVGDNSETQGIGSKAIEQLPAKIVEANGTEGVDAVSGATVTSKAIFTAVEDCLEQAGTTDTAPAAAASSTHSDASASDSKTTDSSDSLIVTTDDYLGTTRLGKMSITIPDTYTCEKFDQSPTSDGTQAVEAAYSRTLSKTSAIFIKEVFLADAAADFDDPSFLIDLLVSADLEATSSDGSCETVEEMSQLGNDTYFGIYTIKLEGTDVTVLGGGAVDEDGNLLLVRVFVLGNADSDDVFEVVDSIEVNCAPESPSNSSSTSLSLSQSSRGLSGSSTRSSGSSYTPTRGEQNALSRANDYLEFMSFSRSGLIDQLEFEGYTTSEAEYAVDNCGADWDEQAVLKAEEYLDFMSFSRSGLIDQLEFEGFTHDQASAAATAVGL